jgi:REP element-mobilizing transposase RayT
MSEEIHREHNVTVLLYHLVFPCKYRRGALSPQVEQVLRQTCQHIGKTYEITFLEIGTDNDHVHFLVQSVPKYSVTQIVRTMKSLTAKAIFKRVPLVRKQLWGHAFWTSGYFASTVGQHANEATIHTYVKQQGRHNEYRQLSLFDEPI